MSLEKLFPKGDKAMEVRGRTYIGKECKVHGAVPVTGFEQDHAQCH